ncbi:hypothetical protein TNCT_137821 [Trichonephila clavata]|uniref:Uncharacterized protein n=1 Tax=Trichonephila clavata TaxID=2740835 RepID=A0A8X6KQ13_TRICU|nr:hypothetical protein TNCT_137821 [Trichonephila clavata]
MTSTISSGRCDDEWEVEFHKTFCGAGRFTACRGGDWSFFRSFIPPPSLYVAFQISIELDPLHFDSKWINGPFYLFQPLVKLSGCTAHLLTDLLIYIYIVRWAA